MYYFSSCVWWGHTDTPVMTSVDTAQRVLGGTVPRTREEAVALLVLYNLAHLATRTRFNSVREYVTPPQIRGGHPHTTQEDDLAMLLRTLLMKQAAAAQDVWPGELSDFEMDWIALSLYDLGRFPNVYVMGTLEHTTARRAYDRYTALAEGFAMATLAVQDTLDAAYADEALVTRVDNAVLLAQLESADAAAQTLVTSRLYRPLVNAADDRFAAVVLRHETIADIGAGHFSFLVVDAETAHGADAPRLLYGDSMARQQDVEGDTSFLIASGVAAMQGIPAADMLVCEIQSDATSCGYRTLLNAMAAVMWLGKRRKRTLDPHRLVDETPMPSARGLSCHRVTRDRCAQLLNDAVNKTAAAYLALRVLATGPVAMRV